MSGNSALVLALVCGLLAVIYGFWARNWILSSRFGRKFCGRFCLAFRPARLIRTMATTGAAAGTFAQMIFRREDQIRPFPIKVFAFD